MEEQWVVWSYRSLEICVELQMSSCNVQDDSPVFQSVSLQI